MTRHGLLTKDRFAPVVPVHAPTYLPAPTVDFGDVDMLSITYRTDFGAAAQIVPDALELDDEPQVTLSFISYGVSGAGSYREVVHSIACRHQGQPVGYVPHIFVTNEPAMLAGREWLGWPKLLADISFSTETTTMDGVISGPTGASGRRGTGRRSVRPRAAARRPNARGRRRQRHHEPTSHPLCAARRVTLDRGVGAIDDDGTVRRDLGRPWQRTAHRRFGFRTVAPDAGGRDDEGCDDPQRPPAVDRTDSDLPALMPSAHT